MGCKAHRVPDSDSALLDASSSAWTNVPMTAIDLFPAPLPMVEAASPFLARSAGHGTLRRIELAAAHNGRCLAISLRWGCGRHAEIVDLDQFVDAVAVLFPMSRTAIAMTMGSAEGPVNGWLWRANRQRPYEIMGTGYAAVRRLDDEAAGDLTASARHDGSSWHVVFRRGLSGKEGQVSFLPGQDLKIALAAWDGGNAERSGRKSISGDFTDFSLEA
ncbi:MAG: ethylbenzene dehydrogenase [Deltaproteobacteria bacterium]|nr:ethylbenzene dehydrogenase [Deltaproteobacteria bacterium]